MRAHTQGVAPAARAADETSPPLEYEVYAGGRGGEGMARFNGVWSRTFSPPPHDWRERVEAGLRSGSRPLSPSSSSSASSSMSSSSSSAAESDDELAVQIRGASKCKRRASTGLTDHDFEAWLDSDERTLPQPEQQPQLQHAHQQSRLQPHPEQQLQARAGGASGPAAHSAELGPITSSTGRSRKDEARRPGSLSGFPMGFARASSKLVTT